MIAKTQFVTSNRDSNINRRRQVPTVGTVNARTVCIRHKAQCTFCVLVICYTFDLDPVMSPNHNIVKMSVIGNLRYPKVTVRVLCMRVPIHRGERFLVLWSAWHICKAGRNTIGRSKYDVFVLIRILRNNRIKNSYIFLTSRPYVRFQVLRCQTIVLHLHPVRPE